MYDIELFFLGKDASSKEDIRSLANKNTVTFINDFCYIMGHKDYSALPLIKAAHKALKVLGIMDIYDLQIDVYMKATDNEIYAPSEKEMAAFALYAALLAYTEEFGKYQKDIAGNPIDEREANLYIPLLYYTYDTKPNYEIEFWKRVDLIRRISEDILSSGDARFNGSQPNETSWMEVMRNEEYALTPEGVIEHIESPAFLPRLFSYERFARVYDQILNLLIQTYRFGSATFVFTPGL